jgi:hypothetical protein
MPRFQMVNGILVDTQKTTPSTGIQMVAVVSTPAQAAEDGIPIAVAVGVAVERYADNAGPTKAAMHCESVDMDACLERLTNIFARFEVPIGMLTKLMQLSEYAINIVIDDSGSMSSPTDSCVRDVDSEYMREFFASHQRASASKLTRFEEEEDRLHLMIEILAYVPTGPIRVSCMNRHAAFLLERVSGEPPESFAARGHQYVREMFGVSLPAGGTPTKMVMEREFHLSWGRRTAHYLFTDGVPSDCTTQLLGQILSNRADPENHPLTFVSCTNVDAEAEWMKEIEERGPFMAEVDDYRAELAEVRAKQGPAFPYTRGMWLMCLLVGAINPYDLDALDDAMPLTKFTFDQVMGRVLSQEEYAHYWANHPSTRRGQFSMSEFANFQGHAKQMHRTIFAHFGRAMAGRW